MASLVFFSAPLLFISCGSIFDDAPASFAAETEPSFEDRGRLFITRGSGGGFGGLANRLIDASRLVSRGQGNCFAIGDVDLEPEPWITVSVSAFAVALGQPSTDRPIPRIAIPVCAPFIRRASEIDLQASEVLLWIGFGESSLVRTVLVTAGGCPRATGPRGACLDLVASTEFEEPTVVRVGASGVALLGSLLWFIEDLRPVSCSPTSFV